MKTPPKLEGAPLARTIISLKGAANGVKAHPLISRREVGVWIRVSTEEQAEGDSPRHHELRARAYAEARGWNVREVYDLSGVSGKTVKDHPEAKRMIADVKRGHVSALIFSKLARLARNTKELLDFSDHFSQYQADLISLQENIDTGTPAGRLFYTVIAAMAQWEREEIVSRINASVATRAKLGEPLTGRAPFGYHWVDKKVVPHPEEAPVRRLIYELYAEHRRRRTVARILNQRGFKTRKGRFTDTTVERLIRDTTAKGEHRTNFTRAIGPKRKVHLKPESEWIINPVEPIVPLRLWEDCNAILDNTRIPRNRVGPKSIHPFIGFTFCQCGQKMSVLFNSPSYTCVQCRNKIAQDTLDQIFRQELGKLTTPAETVAAQLDDMRVEREGKEATVAAFQKEIERLDGEIETLFNLYNQGGLNADNFRARYDPLENKKGEIHAEIAHAEGMIAALKVDELSVGDITETAVRRDAKWAHMEPEEKRRIVEQTIEQIVISDNDAVLHFCLHPSFGTIAEKQRTSRGSSRRPA